MDCRNLDMIRLLLVIIFAALDKCYSLKCFECSASDIESCKNSQKLVSCVSLTENEHPVCLTMKYTEIINKGVTTESSVVKMCSSGKNGCRDHCYRKWSNCQTDCCTKDHCNIDDNLKPKVWLGSKRSNPDPPSNSSNALHKGGSYLLLTVISCLVVKFIL